MKVFLVQDNINFTFVLINFKIIGHVIVIYLDFIQFLLSAFLQIIIKIFIVHSIIHATRQVVVISKIYTLHLSVVQIFRDIAKIRAV